MLKNSFGGITVSTLIYLLVAILAIYALIKVVPPYMHYYAMDDEVAQQVKMSKINSADTIRKDLLAKADELGIYIAPEYLEISYDDNRAITIYVAWAEEADFGYGITRTFDFEVNATGTGFLEE